MNSDNCNVASKMSDMLDAVDGETGGEHDRQPVAEFYAKPSMGDGSPRRAGWRRHG